MHLFVIQSSLKKLAKEAFRSWVRAYTAHRGDLKRIFVVKKLHLGHVARSFGLKEQPSLVGKSFKMQAKKRKRDHKQGYLSKKRPAGSRTWMPCKRYALWRYLPFLASLFALNHAGVVPFKTVLVILIPHAWDLGSSSWAFHCKCACSQWLFWFGSSGGAWLWQKWIFKISWIQQPQFNIHVAIWWMEWPVLSPHMA